VKGERPGNFRELERTCEEFKGAMEALTGRLDRGLAGPEAASGLRRPCA
jgi:hypothetical protein